ncbi:hypothetical protein GCM10009609_48200 [Pseudonocardia aurantiaca]|uniref:Solute:sodium symporter small subunit n=1 Tax=Pseudonocardia aurantiaca TaxID=75290 RepID=A0ABW4FXF4_9PSEU
MKSYIRSLPSAAIETAFGIVYAVSLLMALFPPLYLAASGVRASVLGIPVAIAYWIADAALIGLALWAKYAIEDVRGELDEEFDATPDAPVAHPVGTSA